MTETQRQALSTRISDLLIDSNNILTASKIITDIAENAGESSNKDKRLELIERLIFLGGVLSQLAQKSLDNAYEIEFLTFNIPAAPDGAEKAAM